MGKITIHTKATAEDYRALVFFTIYMKNKVFNYFVMVVAALALAAVIGRLAGIISMPAWYLYVCLAFWGLIALNYFVYRYTVKRFLASDKILIDREYTVKIDEAGITSENEKAGDIASYKWDVFYKACETNKFFYLYLNTAMAVILPKRDLSDEEIPALEKLIRDKLGNNFKKR